MKQNEITRYIAFIKLANIGITNNEATDCLNSYQVKNANRHYCC